MEKAPAARDAEVARKDGFSVRLELADAQVWRDLQPTMDVIASQITFYGEEPPEVSPAYCQLDPQKLPR